MTAIDPAEAPPRVAELLAAARAEVDREIDRRLPRPEREDAAARLIDAMRYAALAPGKRIRPALVLAACEAAGGRRADALPAAAAIEILHSYTLVHDDLPAMDDDDERRGRPTVHRAFDEATAILAGDGLLTAAFAALAELGASAAAAVSVLAARSSEVLAGQALDLAAAGGAPPTRLEELERIHQAKTGALFAAAAELGAIAAGAAADRRALLAAYGMAIGTAFQYADDADDGDFPDLAQAAARRRAELGRTAMAVAHKLPRPEVLVELARWVSGL